MTIELSNISPDFNDLVSQLQTILASKDTWKDRLTTSTGQTLIEMIAAIGAYSQYSIESAFQENWPQSAKNANSLYAASNFMGVRVNRKGPSSITINFVAPSAVSLPAYSQFTGVGSYWFNRDPIVYDPAILTPLPVVLYQGQVKTENFYGLGSNFQAFITTETAFTVADQDITLEINNVSIPVIQEGLWTKPTLPGVQDMTLPSGQMMLLFGNAIYGSLPTVNDLCTVTYVVTLGVNGDNIPTLSQKFNLETDTTKYGIATTQASGGGDQTSYLVYKNITPALFGAFSSSVTGNQYKRLPIQYPGVLDAKTFSQREINPFALTWMNVIKVCLLTNTVMDTAQWHAFETWYLDQTMYSTRIYRQDPIASNVNVNAKVYCKNFANTSDVHVNTIAAVAAVFQPRQGIIGLDIYRSDIINAILQADSNVEYVVLNSPATDIILSSFIVDFPTCTVIPSGGTLAVGYYDYCISATSSLGGDSAPSKWTTVHITVPNSRIVLSWAPVTNSVGYKIWGRTTPTPLGLLATVSVSTLTWTDNGTVVPVGSVPVEGTIETYYPRLNSNVQVIGYSNRDTLS
jgi:hypothetical protein